MKKIIALFLLITFVLSFGACGTPADNEDSSKGNDSSAAVVDTDAPTSDEPFAYKHVVIVGIDGMGIYHKNADTPNIDRIFADYALTDVAQTYSPVASGPCWMSLLTGADPQVMGLTVNASTNPKAAQKYVRARDAYPTLFRLFHEKYPDSSVASITGYADWQNHMVEDADYIYKEMGYKEWWSNKENTERAVKYIESLDTSKPSFTFVYYIEPDSTGHKKGWGSAEYNAMLTECDAGLGAIFDTCEAKGMLEDTLFVLATDHGGDGTKHGDTYTAPALTITLGFRGKTVAKVKDFPMILRDVSAVVVEALDLSDASWKDLKGPPKVPEGLFAE
jgi:predicted AlkP superfamily pyrophosphatase or phosphodiesterase